MKQLLVILSFCLVLSCNTPVNSKAKERNDSLVAAKAANTHAITQREVDSAVASDIASGKAGELTIMPAIKWQVQDEEDKMDGKVRHSVYVESNNKLSLKFPYEGGVTVLLGLTKWPTKTNVFLQLSKGQFHTKYDGTPIRAKFDNEKPTTWYCSEAADGSSNYLFIRNTSSFIAKLKRSKKLIVEAPLYQNGDQIIEFDVVGLSWK